MRRSLILFSMVFFGGVLLTPVVGRLPMVGWDWYYFFTRHDPVYNVAAGGSAYPPYTAYLVDAIAWMGWRESLVFLNSLTLVTVALATWQNGGRYGSVVMALLAPPLWYLMWIGHPDGLALLGLLVGFVPLALIKPQLTIFSMFSQRSLLAWTVLFLLATLMVWPLWPARLGLATFGHGANFGWSVSGWPVLATGVFLLLGAGRSPYRLMAAGLLISPYLMPYNLAVLLPVIGQVRGYRQILILFAAWLTLLGVGLPWPVKYLNLLFPLSAYCLTHSVSGYLYNFTAVVSTLRHGLSLVWGMRNN